MKLVLIRAPPDDDMQRAGQINVQVIDWLAGTQVYESLGVLLCHPGVESWYAHPVKLYNSSIEAIAVLSQEGS